MNTQPPINDWSEHMLWAETNFKKLERGLINKDDDKLDHYILNTIDALQKVRVWIEEHRAK